MMISDKLKIALADTFAMYIKAHSFHWNVTGPDFAMYHDFFGELYEEIYGAVDPIAELIRTTGEYAPGNFTRFAELSTINEQNGVPSAEMMLEELLQDNYKVINSLTDAYETAEDERKFGISNFIQDRLTAHDKHKWMLQAFTKR
jgi:starvation-inducible DNA-binding protein